MSHSFGYGLMDASAMVDLAMNWTTVPEQHTCIAKARLSPRYACFLLIHFTNLGLFKVAFQREHRMHFNQLSLLHLLCI